MSGQETSPNGRKGAAHKPARLARYLIFAMVVAAISFVVVLSVYVFVAVLLPT